VEILMNTDPQPASAAFNPMLQPWTDMSLRMLDWMVSSTQQAGEQVDRMARAGGPARTQELASHAAGTAAGSALSAATQWHSSTLEWMTQAWQQWFDFVLSMNRLAAPMQEATARMAQPAAAVAQAAASQASEAVRTAADASSGGSRAARHDGGAREPHSARDGQEHATASSATRRAPARRGGARASAKSPSSRARATARGK
jgi:hypothetical protein